MKFSRYICDWYDSNFRDLPWRQTTDPYRIWLSEIILQQTRVDQGMSYYLKFIDQYPTVFDLANANEDHVLKNWQGLGYYSRARNLHYTAQYIVSELEGKFPNNFKELKKLKGVGDYTAAAIASFSFKEPVAVVDGNVYRVLSRYYGVSTPIDSTEGKKQFQELANTSLNPDQPDKHNQAIMEFGALFCTPKKPNCSSCGLKNSCWAYGNNKVEELPIKSKKTKQKTVYFNYLYITDDEFCLLNKRAGKGIWQNLHEFPLLESKKEIDSPDKLEHPLLKNLTFNEVSHQYKHILSHRIILAKFWSFSAANVPNTKGLIRTPIKELHQFAVPKLIENYLNDIK